MPDTKITALTAIGANPIIPSTFPIPMVDLTDTSMAASGTTKKVTVNQILGAGGTATLASATITGAASAAGLSVTGSTIPTNGVYLPSANNLGFAYNSTLGMTLNATGLGVGISSPFADAGYKSIDLRGTTGGEVVLGSSSVREATITADGTNGMILNTVNSTPLRFYTQGGEKMRLDVAGNLGIGVTPSAWLAAVKAIDIGSNALAAYSGGITHNAYFDNTDSRWEYKGTGAATFYSVQGGLHSWYVAASGTANNPITTFANAAMTLDASGNLLCGSTALNATWNTRLTLSSDSGTTRWAVGPYSTATNFVISAASGGGVYLNGTAATSWTSASDERLKDIIEPISNAIAKVGSLRAVIGKFKSDDTNTRKSFLMAQDVQSVLPEAVDASNPDRLGLAYTDVIPLLVAAIKELTARVQTLETR